MYSARGDEFMADGSHLDIDTLQLAKPPSPLKRVYLQVDCMQCAVSLADGDRGLRLIKKH